jgi:hypothetical protein
MPPSIFSAASSQLHQIAIQTPRPVNHRIGALRNCRCWRDGHVSHCQAVQVPQISPWFSARTLRIAAHDPKPRALLEQRLHDMALSAAAGGDYLLVAMPCWPPLLNVRLIK